MGSESDSGSVVDGVERSNCGGCRVSIIAPSVRAVRLSTGCGFSSGVADASTCTGQRSAAPLAAELEKESWGQYRERDLV
jgi:hypothetical protein